jgi:CBS domain-containing protein/gamma-glutamyl:cysteine ligase YbdK (ATP-grasp superfamily)
MGKDILTIMKNPGQKQEFMRHLLNDLKALEYMLKNDLFEKNITRIGVEQELDFVDKDFNPAPIAMEVLEELDVEYLTTEYAKFNLEINVDPMELKGKVLSELSQDLLEKLNKVTRSAKKRGCDIILTGILPTLRRNHLSMDNLTPNPRYETMLDVVNKSRGKNYEFHIKGLDELITRENPTIFGGSFTSFQIHLQENPAEIVSQYNWAQAISGPILASAVNSPLFLKKRLWQETRIALFQQTTDTRKPYENHKQENARVQLGSQWVKDSILEVFQEDLSQYKIFVGNETTENAMEVLENGGVPKLNALSFHNGTIYRWNRVCYGVTENKPHLRIENRILPAGPTLEDQIANAAFWIGMMKGMPKKYANIADKLDFDKAKSNFYKAARYGLDVQFDWIKNTQVTAKELILDELLPIAEEGLKKCGINEDDISKYLFIIEKRVSTGKTGAKWMLDNFNRLKEKISPDEAVANITATTIKRQLKDKPIHDWTSVRTGEAGIRSCRTWTIERIMSKNLYTVQPDDLLEMAANIMMWKNIRHLPVESKSGKIVGLLTQKSLFKYMVETKCNIDEVAVKDVMLKELVTVNPDDLILHAIQLMLDFKITCLPVIDNNNLAGIVTEHDFVKFSKQLFQQMEKQKKS